MSFSLPTSTPEQDPHLRPPTLGTLGPGADIAGLGTNPIPTQKRGSAIGPIVAVAIGVAIALLYSIAHKNNPAGSGLTGLLPGAPPKVISANDTRQLDRMKPQNQAETLLELALKNSDGAVEQISERVDRWHGRVQWDSQIANLSAAALNSRDLRVRESGVEVELAAYGLSKNSASLNYLLKTAESPDHEQKIWALWALGLMGNRGVEPDQVIQVLTSHLQDSDEDSRRWAVEGLALTGADGAIEPLLKTMHDDSSGRVRERAACGIAESGLFTPEQRSRAIPTLLSYMDDPTLDAPTHGWAFEALGDITHQHLPHDASAWSDWYESNRPH